MLTCPKCGHAFTPANPISAVAPRWCASCKATMGQTWANIRAHLSAMSALTRARRCAGLGTEDIDKDPVKYAARMVRIQGHVDRIWPELGFGEGVVIPGKPGELVRIVEAQREAA